MDGHTCPGPGGDEYIRIPAGQFGMVMGGHIPVPVPVPEVPDPQLYPPPGVPSATQVGAPEQEEPGDADG